MDHLRVLEYHNHITFIQETLPHIILIWVFVFVFNKYGCVICNWGLISSNIVLVIIIQGISNTTRIVDYTLRTNMEILL